MGERITVPCQRCGDEIVFEVEAWASPPERAYCDEACYAEREAPRAHAAVTG